MEELLTALTQAGAILTFEYRDEMFFIEGAIEDDVVFSLCALDMTSARESLVAIVATTAFTEWKRYL